MPEGTKRDVWITGIGLVSSLGERPEAHWQALSAGQAPVVDAERFAPYVVHPLVKLVYDSQIPKKATSARWRPGSASAPIRPVLALDSAGISKNADILGRTDMIVGAGGGERDHQVDTAILNDVLASKRSRQAAERAPAGGPAPHPFAGAAFQSSCRQHLHRARRHRLLAHLHGRGERGRGRGAHRLGAHRRRPERDRPRGRRLTMPSARTCCSSTR